MLINNAGIAYTGPFELLPFDDFRLVINVNLLGHVRVTQKFLPLIRKVGEGARIVNIASLAGRIASEGFSAYSGSKFAIEAVSDALRRELMHLKISVSTIEPAFARTNIFDNGGKYIDKIWEQASDEQKSVYKAYRTSQSKARKEIIEKADDPKVVVDAIIDACTSPTPKIRYLVCKGAKLLAFLAWFLPDHVMDCFLERMTKKQAE